MNPESQNDEQQENEISIPINYKYSRNVPLSYVNQVMVQGSQHEMVISFFESVLNLERTDEPDLMRKFAETGIDAECVARIVVSRSFYPALVETLKRNMPIIDKEQLRELLTQLTEETSEGE